jgi:16S rRNA (cytosine967-C5)-methyltransferase
VTVRDRPRVTARGLALDVLGRCLGPDAVPAEESFAAHPGRADLSNRDRAFARLLIATVLRRLGQLDAVLAAFWRQRPRRQRTLDALRLGAAQLLLLGTPAHAAVAETVGCVVPPDRGMVNAILRRVATEGQALLAAQDAPVVNTPGWLLASWREAYGEAHARATARAHLEPPPLDLAARDDPAALAARTGGTPLAGQTVRLAGSHVVDELPGYDEGLFWVQDVAASLPVRLLGDVRDRRVLDLCAAPGGKTAQLAAAGARVTAVEADPQRCRRLAANLARLRLDAELIEADVLSLTAERLGRFDRVLLDAPCTATGTIRRHPDIAWHKRAYDVVRLAQRQRALLDHAAGLVRPGGLLVYAVCSLQPEEGEPIIDSVLAARDDLVRSPVTPGELADLGLTPTASGTVRTFPFDLGEKGGMDGFFIARLQRVEGIA